MALTTARPFTVIIPAYNEEAVIARCLSTLDAGIPDNHAMEVIVAANGCEDATIEIARATWPQARIVELAQGSKTAAINAANEVASHFPRIYLDADVGCSYRTALALVDALENSGAMVAAPAINIDLGHSDWLVRAYFRSWLKQPYAKSGNGGAGCYALSRAALEESGTFPDIIGDDIWIHTRFSSDRKLYVAHDQEGQAIFTTVYPPRSAREQIKVEARRQIGNAEVLRRHPSPFNLKSIGGGAVRAGLESGTRVTDLIVFLSMKLAARLLAKWNHWRGRGAVWSRDMSSRQPT